jgi:four helix bundle protein
VGSLEKIDGRGKMEDGRKNASERIKTVRDLKVYKKAFDAAMEIFELSKSFPREELYSLTDQIRRSSRSVCANISEGWRKRRYRAVFTNKLSDSGQEAGETQTWLEFSLACKYIEKPSYDKLYDDYEEIFAMLYSMTEKADTFCSGK